MPTCGVEENDWLSDGFAAASAPGLSCTGADDQNDELVLQYSCQY